VKVVTYILALSLFSCAEHVSKTEQVSEPEQASKIERVPQSSLGGPSGYRMIVSEKGVRCGGGRQSLKKGERFKDETYFEKFGECLSAIPYRLVLKGIFLGNNRIQCEKELRFYKEDPSGNDSFYEKAEFSDYDSCQKSASLKNQELREKLIKKYIGKNPKYSEYEEWAKRGILRVGMPEELVYLTWGQPTKTNTTKGKFGVQKKLLYQTTSSTKYAYIQNGYLTTIQE
jgi:hypothetical protein